MNVDRYMVNLFFEIRRNIPASQARDLKLADPNLGDAMVKLYQSTDDENIRLLTEIFLEKAGGNWLKKANPSKAAKLLKKLKLKESLEKTSETNRDTNKQKSKKSSSSKPRYYRGALVKDD